MARFSSIQFLYVDLCYLKWFQRDDGDEELCSVYVPTNHLYIGDVFLVNSKEIIRPNLSIREGIGESVALLSVPHCFFIGLDAFRADIFKGK